MRTRTGVWVEHRNALLAGSVLEESFFGAVITGACQAGKVDKQWDSVERVEDRLWWHVEVEPHFAIGGGGIVGAFEQLAAEAGDGGFRRHGHCVLSMVREEEREMESVNW